MLRILSILPILGLVGACQAYVQETQPEWQPRENSISTSWASDIAPENVHPEYPRPQLVRDSWMNLNGLWDYAITPRGDPS